MAGADIGAAPRLPALAALTLAAAALIACDGHGDRTTITRVIRDAALDRSIFTAHGAARVEVHGAPLSGMTAEETASLLRAPQGYPEGVRFATLPPGGFDPRDPSDASRFRIALVFNARPAASPEAICRTARELGGAPADADGYAVDAAVCRDMEPIASLRMTARARDRADPEFVKRTLRRLMQSLIG